MARRLSVRIADNVTFRKASDDVLDPGIHLQLSKRREDSDDIESDEYSDIEVNLPRFFQKAVNPLYDCFSTVLDVCTDELNILVYLFKQKHLQKQTVFYEPLSARYGSGEKEEEERRSYIINDVYTNYHKLQKDVALIVDVLADTSAELKSGTKSILESSVLALEAMWSDDYELIKTEYKNHKKMHELKNQLIKFHQESSKSRSEADAHVKTIGVEYDTILTFLTLQMRYVDEWENSRAQQHHTFLQRQENEIKHIIQSTKEKMSTEMRCHDELVRYITESQQDLQNEIENWMNKYEKDTEDMDESILKMKIKLEQIKEDREALRQLYDQHIEDMIKWQEYKYQKAIEMWQLKVKHKAATKIQNWWRATMIRLSLGPYKKKKKGKGKDKDKKKK